MEDFGRFENFAQLRNFLKSALYEHLFAVEGKSTRAKKYRFEHCLRVAKIGREIAFNDSTSAQPIDPDLLELGCLLHDIGKWDAPIPVDHGRAGALSAYPLLREAGLTQAVCQELAQGIAMHVDNIWNPGVKSNGFADRTGRKYFIFDSEPSLLAHLIGQCDDLDRFSTYRIFDTLHHFNFLDLSSKAQIEWIDRYLDSLEIESKKLRSTETLRRRWNENITYQRHYFRRLRAEIVSDAEV